MATYIKTLKEDNGDITYPQTKAGAVLLNNGSDLETELSQYVTAEDIASTSALTPPVQTNMIADGAVTKAKINFSTLKPYWKVVATSSTATVTIPRGYKIYRFTCEGKLPVSSGTRAVINCPQRASGSNCYVAWHGKCSASSATSGAFIQSWGGEARAISYLEPVATGASNTWRATGTIQFENKTGKSYVSVNIDSVAAGSDDTNHSKGETDISAGDTFTLVIHRGSRDATSGYWVVEALDEN